ncbi:MAG TPA: S8 family serine peptidase [Terriglobales bacterium]|nr:S8 family serine peptidase [Terriglobales bacterium]
MHRCTVRFINFCLLLAAFLLSASAQSDSRVVGINVLLKSAPTPAVLSDLGKHGKIRDVVEEIKAVTLQAPLSELAVIQGLTYVASANQDSPRGTGPVDTVTATDFVAGISTWDLDAINVTNPGAGRTTSLTGAGVNVAVIDTGLVDNWRQYFPEQRILSQYGAAFAGGGGEVGSVSTQPNKWEHDQNSHGTHVTSTILGYSLAGTPVNGVAPQANVVPIKVLNQNGSGWSSVVARGIVYAADLKEGPLAGSPMVINMSLGGPTLDAMEKAAIDYAALKGVIIVAAAGNEDNHGMGYPGAYAPVISVAAAGWTGEWKAGTDNVVGNWWWKDNVADPTNPADYYITDFSSRALAGQQLDVAAPGSWVVGPYQLNGQLSYYFLGGTSMASPHVAGIAALLAQRDPNLTNAQAESILKAAAAMAPMNSGCQNIKQPDGSTQNICWGPGHDPATSLDADGSGFVTLTNALSIVY